MRRFLRRLVLGATPKPLEPRPVWLPALRMASFTVAGAGCLAGGLGCVLLTLNREQAATQLFAASIGAILSAGALRLLAGAWRPQAIDLRTELLR